MVELNFDAGNVPVDDFEALPAGRYKAMILESERKEAKNGSNKFLLLKMVILGGEYDKRLIWDRLNLWNTNSQAQGIAEKQFSALCHSVGVLQVTDSAQLHNLPFMVELTCQKSTYYDDGRLENNVKKYLPCEKVEAEDTATGDCPF